MKNIFLFLALTTSVFFYSQEKIEYIDYDEILQEIEELSDKNENEKIIEHLNKISINDSVYESSLITKSYYLLQQDKYDEAVKISDMGLKLPNGLHRYSFLLNKGVALLRSERYEEALKLCNNTIKEYPKNYVLFYNRGIIHERLKQFDKAIKDYIQSITLNPFYAKSHLQLGRLCARERKTSQALMAINMYLLLNPDGEDSFTILNSLNVSVSKNSEIEPRGITISDDDDDTFQEIDLILNNRIALNPNYKIENKINIALTKQNHALFEQLDDYEGNNGFWDRKYVPFYKWVFNNGHFNDFTYTISYAIENEEFKKIVQKNVDNIQTFIDVFYEKWGDIVSNENQQLFEGKEQKVTHLFNNYSLQAVGKTSGDKKVGNWEVYSTQGKLKGKGRFDDSGKRIGEWVWYDSLGNIESTEQYKDGKLEGNYTSFYINKNIDVTCSYKSGKLEGTYKKHNKKGALIEKKVFIDDILDGSYESYYAIGESAKEYVLTYNNDQPQGELLQYHPNGEVFMKRNYKNGEIIGKENKYYNNGILRSENEYTNGVYNGVYSRYYKNGTKYEEGTAVEGYYDGGIKLYFDDGVLKNEFSYSKGKLNGLYKEFDVDGKLYYEFVYRNDEFIEYKYYNKEGDAIKEAKKKKGEFYYQGYSPLGDLVTEGMYDVKGGKKGEWKFYENGVLINKGTYEDNKLNGKYYGFYKSGQKESISEYKNDSLIGYYVAFHKNGKMSRQGWHKNNKSHGIWISYYDDGKIEHKKFFHKGDQHGVQEFYSVEGKLWYQLFYEYGNLVSEKYYTPTGEVLQEIKHDPTKKEFTSSFKQYNGNVYSTTDYLYGIKHGNYTRYYADGKKNIEGKYFNGEFHGDWIWYHDNGEISMKGSYFHGDHTGNWETYFKSGKLKEKYSYKFGKLEGPNETYNEEGVLTRVIPYKNDKIHGERMFYSPEGKLQVVRYYHNDEIIGYSYNDENGKLKPMIPIENYTGVIKAYFDNGKPSIEAEFKNGIFINEFNAYYYSGKLERNAKYKDGDNHGKYMFYYPDGKVKKEMNYRYDKLHGPYIEYYTNGNRKEEVNYIHHNRSGIAKYYDENGKLIKEQSYFNDFVEK